MSVPSADWADARPVVDLAKVTDYLLSFDHPDGYTKARFFARFGFDAGRPLVFVDALVRHRSDSELQGSQETPYGVRYVVHGVLQSPDGRNPLVRSVWFEEQPGIVRLVTVYPLREAR
ncbi:MAG: hypothetical protein C0506_05500 [Anaerolinea sp.]|nr:hypothetical protein [Anaerolinea sp.]